MQVDTNRPIGWLQGIQLRKPKPRREVLFWQKLHKRFKPCDADVPRRAWVFYGHACLHSFRESYMWPRPKLESQRILQSIVEGRATTIIRKRYHLVNCADSSDDYGAASSVPANVASRICRNSVLNEEKKTPINER